MKVITVNFVTCAVKSCKTSPSSFPLHFRDAEFEQQELEFQPRFIQNVLPRLDWDSLRLTANELGFSSIPIIKPEGDILNEEMLKDLHRLLLETRVVEGKLVCENCGHEYRIKDGIANFLLPSHLGLLLHDTNFLPIKARADCTSMIMSFVSISISRATSHL